MNRLTERNFSFQCPMKWDDMEPSENGRFCSQCRKEVFDLTDCSIEEVRALKEKHGSICGTIRIAQVAAVAMSLTAAACNDEKPKAAGTTNSPPTPPSKVEPGVERLTGDVCLPPIETPKNPTPDAPNPK